jgi:glycosyltransferase involved in cell wall biosynthesis
MNIGLILFELNASGGEQRQVLRLGRGLRELGHEVTIYAYRYNPTACYPSLAQGLNIRAVHTLSDDQVPTSRSSPSGVLSVAFRRYFLESRVLERLIGDEEVLNPHSRPAHRTAVFAKRRRGAPVVWTCNDVVGWEKPDHRARMGKFLHRRIARVMQPRERAMVEEIDAIAVLSEEVRHTIEAAYGRPAHIIHTGVDCDTFSERPEGGRAVRCALNIPQDSFLSLWLGVYEPFRRIEDLLEAIRILRSKGELVRCLIAGRSDVTPVYACALKRFVSEHGLGDQVCFAEGSIPEEELPDYYSACDVLVFPNDEQSWGLAPLEALACNRPVVVSRGSGIQEAMLDGETALLVPPRCPEALSEAILRLKLDAALRERIRRQGRKLVARELSWTEYVRQTAALLEETVSAHGREYRPARTKRVRGQKWLGRFAQISEPVWRIR